MGARGATVSSMIALHKARGSGWQGAGQPRVDAETLETMRQRTDWGELLDEAEPPQVDEPFGEIDW